MISYNKNDEKVFNTKLLFAIIKIVFTVLLLVGLFVVIFMK